MEYVVSACLAGCHCRYDGDATPDERVINLIRQGRALPVCPEQLGGMPTPRAPFELKDGKAIDKEGNDVSEPLEFGSDEAVRLALLAGCTKALLKARSPSCGAGKIYDGTFQSNLIDGDGMFAAKLRKEGLTIVTELTAPDSL